MQTIDDRIIKNKLSILIIFIIFAPGFPFLLIAINFNLTNSLYFYIKLITIDMMNKI